MQLPGMATDPVRLSVELTWWPEDGSFSVSRRLWTRPAAGTEWRLEDMATSASPLGLVTLPQRWRQMTDHARIRFMQLVEEQGEPF